MKEGEGMFACDGCPEHGTRNLYRKMINGMWHELCSVQNCYYCDIVLRERKQSQPIPFDDRRKNEC